MSAKIERAVGRISERYSGISRWVVVEVLESEGKSRVEWQVKSEYASEVTENEGVYVLLWCIEHTHRSHGWTLTGRRVLDVLSGIELATVTLRAGDGRKIALERISSPRTEEVQVLDTLSIRLPRKPRADRPSDLQLSFIDSGDQFSP